jgi:hypothetical protein
MPMGSLGVEGWAPMGSPDRGCVLMGRRTWEGYAPWDIRTGWTF